MNPGKKVPSRLCFANMNSSKNILLWCRIFKRNPTKMTPSKNFYLKFLNNLKESDMNP